MSIGLNKMDIRFGLIFVLVVVTACVWFATPWGWVGFVATVIGYTALALYVQLDRQGVL